MPSWGENLAAYLKQLRGSDKTRTQQWLADKIGVSRATVNRWEKRGAGHATLNEVEAIAAALVVEPSQLLKEVAVQPEQHAVAREEPEEKQRGSSVGILGGKQSGDPSAEAQESKARDSSHPDMEGRRHDELSATEVRTLIRDAVQEAVQASRPTGLRGEILDAVTTWDDDQLRLLLKQVRATTAHASPVPKLPVKTEKGSKG